MLHIEFKIKEPRDLKFKKRQYAQALAILIKELLYLKRVMKHLEIEIDFDYKIIFK